nr:exodeoxyribonuclease VII large subunit [Streptococcus oralis]
YDCYLQRLDQLQLRLKLSLLTRISDSNRLVHARTHQLVQLSPATKIQRYQDRLGQLDKLLRSQMTLVHDAKVAEVKRL